MYKEFTCFLSGVNRDERKALGSSRPRAVVERFGTRRVRAETAVSKSERYQVRVSPIIDKSFSALYNQVYYTILVFCEKSFVLKQTMIGIMNLNIPTNETLCLLMIMAIFAVVDYTKFNHMKATNTQFALFRKENNLYQKDLAAYLGVTVGFISAIERGESKLPEEHLQTLLANDKGWNTERLSASVKELDVVALQKEVKLLQNSLGECHDIIRGLREENKQLRESLEVESESAGTPSAGTLYSLNHTIKHLRDSMEAWKEIYKVMMTYKPNPESGLHVGDIIAERYGFDKTYYAYYLITRLTPAKAEMSPLKCARAGYIRGKCVPILGTEEHTDVKLYTRRIYKGEELVIVNGRYCSRWDGLPDSWDCGYCGDDPSDPVKLFR